MKLTGVAVGHLLAAFLSQNFLSLETRNVGEIPADRGQGG